MTFGYQNTCDIFHKTRINDPKISVETVDDPKLLKQSWEKRINLKISATQISEYTTKLQYPKQYSTGTKTNT